METINDTEVCTRTPNRARRIAAAVGTGVAVAVVPAAGLIGATPPADPTGGGFGDAVDSSSSFISNVAAPALFSLAAIGLGIAIGMKYVRKLRGAA